MLRTTLMAATALACASGALADEVWSTQIGDVVYERDLPTGEAVLSYPAADGEARGLAYVEGLAQTYQGRGAFEGVWIENDLAPDAACSVSISDPETGAPRNNWGRLELVFTEPDFPGGWVAIRGDCFNEPDSYLIGKPVVAEDAQ
ncbi:MAG: hypothetical protein RH945_01045 [Hyphomonas sp.]|tara:strand:+ start:21668 stop:22105 length:438 start_codon:yes stop_codon:yes gene_type:complete